MLVGGDPDPWGPMVEGGRGWRTLTRTLVVLGVAGLVATAAVTTTTGLLVVQRLETNTTRVEVPELDAPVAATDARHFLVVGSDARDGLAAEDRAELTLGAFDGQRSDTVIYVAISEDRSAVSLVSLPRDLLVVDGGEPNKLTDSFAGGPDQLIRVIRENFGLPVNHYAEISLGGFIDVVRTLGGVEICLDEPLHDPKSGADFEAGCHDMDAAEALAYVRSRQGSRSDFERIDRQQAFLRSVLGELNDTRTLANPVRLVQLVEDLASHLTTDEGLGVEQMRSVASEMREVVGQGMPMTTVPAYPRRLNGEDYMIPYRPGAKAMFEDLRAGRPLADRGTREERAETAVALVSGERSGQTVGIVASTLRFAGFGEPQLGGVGPASTDAGDTTTVFVVPGYEDRAQWVAATLGAPTRELPSDVTVPEGVHVLVAVGEDASGTVVSERSGQDGDDGGAVGR